MDERTAKFKTECEKCVFFNDFGQCRINRLDKFITKYGADIVYSTTDFPIIPTWCNTFRSKETNTYNKKLEIQTLKECQIQTDIIVLSYEENGNITRNLARSLESAYIQTPKPNKIIICIKNNDIKYSNLYKHLSNMFDIPITIMRILDKDVNMYSCIDEATRRCTSTYYIVCMSGQTLLPNYIEQLNKKINEDMIMFSSIINKDENILHGTVIQTYLHKLIGGNKEEPVIQKIRKLSLRQNKPEMIIEI